MLSLIVLVGAGALLWRTGQWPFDRSYHYLPKYGESRRRDVGSTGEGNLPS